MTLHLFAPLWEFQNEWERNESFIIVARFPHHNSEMIGYSRKRRYQLPPSTRITAPFV